MKSLPKNSNSDPSRPPESGGQRDGDVVEIARAGVPKPHFYNLGASLVSILPQPVKTARSFRRIFIALAACAVFLGTTLPAAAQDPIHWSVAYTSKDPIQAGSLFDVDVTARIDPTWHLYATTQPPGGP